VHQGHPGSSGAPGHPKFTQGMNTGEKKIDYSTLLKYFEDRATREDVTAISLWLKEPENAYKCEKCLNLLWDELDTEAKEAEVDLEGLLDKIHHTIHLKADTKPSANSSTSSRRPNISFTHVLRNLGRIAAILLVPVSIYIGWEIYSQKMWENNQSEVVYNEIYVPLAAQSQFELPDGTLGYLNNGSSLRYPVKFTGKTRVVELRGEAFFDVKRDKQRPFLINTIGLDVKVLGTRLNIHSYPEDDYQEITLESGMVELVQREEGKEILVAEMKPGQHAVYQFGNQRSKVLNDGQYQELVVAESNEEMDDLASTLETGKQAILRMEEGDLYLGKDEPKYYTGWTDGKLILRNDPMPILLKRIERWYGVKFNIKDEQINDYTYWATFTHETLDQVLELLSLTGQIQFQKQPRETAPDGSFKTQEIDVAKKYSQPS
jgi:transmembrane sensor